MDSIYWHIPLGGLHSEHERYPGALGATGHHLLQLDRGRTREGVKIVVRVIVVNQCTINVMFPHGILKHFCLSRFTLWYNVRNIPAASLFYSLVIVSQFASHFDRLDTIKTPSFSFGGSSGNMVSSLIFKKRWFLFCFQI